MKAAILKAATCGLLSFSLLAGVCLSGHAQANQTPEFLESRELNSRVVKLYSEAKYDEALPLAKRALELREKALGITHEDLIPILINLAELYRAKKHPREARPYLDRALAIAEKIYPERDIRIARLLDKLGITAYEQGDEKKAVSFFTRSFEIKEAALGAEHLETAQTAFSLAEIYRLRHDYQKAEPLYELAIRIREKALGKNPSELISALEGYAAVLWALKKTDDAAQIQKRITELMAAQGIVQGGVLNGKALSLVTPEYPAAARSEHASAIVRVQVLIDENGKVIQAKAIDPGSTHLALINAAEEAARHSRFTPTLLSGIPVKVYGVIIYRFVAQ